MEENKSKWIIEEKQQPLMALFPVDEVDEAVKVLQGELGTFPLYGFFLYSDMDEDIAEFIRMRGQWLHSLSGDDCLIGVFENPGKWGERWESYWRDRLGANYDNFSEKWLNLHPFDRDMAFDLADKLGLEKKTLPCLVFVDDLSSREILSIPLMIEKDKYQAYFQDIFSAVNKASKAPQGVRLQALQSNWKKLWVKWILPKKAEQWATSIQKWGSIITETKEIIVKILNPFSSLIQNVNKG